MGKSQQEQSLAGRNGVSLVRGGGSGRASGAEAGIATEAVEVVAEGIHDGAKDSVSKATVTIPMGVVSGYVSRRIESKRLPTAQAETLNKILNGLAARNATLQNGMPVTTTTRAVQWILENVT
jgi:hypothetical protein